MKKLILLLPFILFAQNMPSMPPMPPMMNIPAQKTDKNSNPKKRPNTSIKNKLPKECQIIPPMLIFMPPPLQKDLSKCKNALFKPTKEKVYKILKLKAKKIEAVSGFTGLYKITTKKNIIYCNKDLNKCFEVKKWIKK